MIGIQDLLNVFKICVYGSYRIIKIIRQLSDLNIFITVQQGKQQFKNKLITAFYIGSVGMENGKLQFFLPFLILFTVNDFQLKTIGRFFYLTVNNFVDKE